MCNRAVVNVSVERCYAPNTDLAHTGLNTANEIA